MSTKQNPSQPSAPTKNDPIVSVIIPVFNRPGFIRQAIDSVVEQSYEDREIIIVDDGSTDLTPVVLAGYGDRIRRIHQPNRGVSAARNTGIRSAKGDLIAFLDADDYWLPGKLARQVAFFQDHPQARICQTEEIWIRNGRRVNPKKRHKKPSGFIFEPSLALCLVSPSAVMLRKTLLEEVGGFDERLPACEDYDLWLRIAWKHPIHLIETPLIVKQGGHPDQLSRMPELDKYRIQAIVKLLNQGCLSPSQHRAALAVLEEKCGIYAGGCRKRGRFEEEEHYLKLPNQFR